jgi:uncharacterized protein YkwD
MSSHLVDILIILARLLYAAAHSQDGVLRLTRRLVSFLGAAVLAFALYARLSAALAPHLSLASGIVDAGSFIRCFIAFEILISLVLRALFSLFPPEFDRSRVSRVLAVVPALLDGLILVSLILFIIVVSPFLVSAKGPIERSSLGGALVEHASKLETYVDQIFGNAAEESLGFQGVEPAEGESLSLPFKATDLSMDAAAEEQMLAFVNAEREKAGAPPLVMDEGLRRTARAHSSDMWQRQYFAHTDPDGHDPFDRMRAGGAVFSTAGENLALARSTERAMEGLMNSPGHRQNILDPDFRRVGIGVVDGGVYGMMFTQDFSD